MRNLKCIGGPNDGEYHPVPDHLKVRNLVQVMKRLKSAVAINYGLDHFPTTIEIGYELYELRLILGINNKTFEFLAYPKLDDIEVIQLQFSKAIDEKFIPVIKALIYDRGFEYSLKSKGKDVQELARAIGMSEQEIDAEDFG